MTVLHLFRHGETDWNRDRRVQGWSDVGLNDDGRRQAREAATRFAALDAPPTIVVASDLARASETAEIVSAALGLAAPRLYASLRERGHGEAEGMAADDALAQWGDWGTSQIPGAESWSDLRARAVRALREVAADFDGQGSASILVVTHGAFIRQLVGHLTDDRLPAPGSRLGNLEGVHVQVDDGRMTLFDGS